MHDELAIDLVKEDEFRNLVMRKKCKTREIYKKYKIEAVKARTVSQAFSRRIKIKNSEKLIAWR